MASSRKIITVNNCAALKKELSGLNLKDSIYILFSGSPNNKGDSWCPDCVKAYPVVNKGFEKSPTKSTLIYCLVGDKLSWRDPNNEFRTDPQFFVKRVPTLLKFGSPKRLEEEKCCKDDLVEMIFEE
ncbi:unnamed protein product [Lymnaea stagnalis]|uniref:Thioredoxin domain-containing protein 17 n=1 Tax=Lymnaea stagnalis TaxID=6523 RepID=A0AAV2HSG4_LYMST